MGRLYRRVLSSKLEENRKGKIDEQQAGDIARRSWTTYLYCPTTEKRRNSYA